MLNYLLKPFFPMVLFLTILTSCNNISTSPPVEDSLSKIDNVSFITGTENTIMTVNRNSDTYFILNFENVGTNGVISDGVGEGWCIDWQKPIDSNGGTYNNIRLYSTFSVPEWNSLNFLLNIKDQLIENDPDIGYREIQLAIWSLRGFPEFNLDDIEITELTPRFHQNGQPLFDRAKVDQILEIVESGYREFAYIEGTKFAIIAETPADIQTVITVAE
jgi:hypothetical protein